MPLDTNGFVPSGAITAGPAPEAAGAIAGVHDVSPEAAVTGIRGAGPMNVPPIVAARTPEVARSARLNDEQNTTLNNDSRTAQFMATTGPEHVAATKNNLPDVSRALAWNDAWKGYMGTSQNWWDPLIRDFAAPTAGAASQIDSTAAAAKAAEDRGDFWGKVGALGNNLVAAGNFAMSLTGIPGAFNVAGNLAGTALSGMTDPSTNDALLKLRFGLTVLNPFASDEDLLHAQQVALHPEHSIQETSEAYNDVLQTFGMIASHEPVVRGVKAGVTGVRGIINRLSMKEAPNPGASVVVDNLRHEFAKSDVQVTAALQDKLSKNPILASSPESMQAIADHIHLNRVVGVDPEKLLELQGQGHPVLEDYAEAAKAAVRNGDEVEVPFSKYLVDTAGKPWADELNEATNFRKEEGGVSLNDAKEVMEQHAARAAASEPVLSAANPPTVVPTLAGDELEKLNNYASYGKISRDATDDETRAFLSALLEKHGVPLEEDSLLYRASKTGTMAEGAKSFSNLKEPGIDFKEAREYLARKGTKVLHIDSILQKAFGEDFESYHEGEFIANAKDITEHVKGEPPSVSLPEGVGQLNPTETQRFGAIAAAYSAKIDELVKPWALSTLIKDPKTLGMTKPVFEAYAKGIEDAIAKAHEKAMDAAVKQVLSERKEPFKNAYNKHYENIMARKGQELRVRATQELRSNKLDRDLVKTLYPELAESVPDSLMKKGGEHPDIAAPILGYDSGKAMLRDIAGLKQEMTEAGAKGVADWIKKSSREPAQAAAASELGFNMDPESIHAAAASMVPEQSVKKFLTAEMQSIIHQMGGEWTPIDDYQIQLRAVNRFDDFRVNRVQNMSNVATLERIVDRARRKGEAALLKQDIPKAFYWKQIEISRRLDLTNAMEFHNDFKTGMNMFQRMARNTKIEGVAQEYVDMIHGLLQQHGMEVPQGNLRFDYAQHVAQMEAKGLPVQPYKGIEGVHPEKMRVGDFLQLKDEVESLLKQGREASILHEGDKEVALDAVVQEAVDKARGLPSKEVKPTPRKGTDEAKTLERQAGETHPETMIDTLDRRDPDGPFNRTLMRPGREAAGKNAFGVEEHINAITKRLNDISSELRHWMKSTVEEGHGLMRRDRSNREEKLLNSDLIGIALHAESAEGLWHLREGGRGYSVTAIKNAVRALPPEAKELVKDLHGLLAPLEGKVIAGEKAITGVAPEAVHGKWFPFQRDHTLASNLGESVLDSRSGLAEYYMKEAAEGRNRLIRKGEQTYPVSLDWESTLRIQLPMIANRLAYGQYLIDADKFLSHPDIRNIIEDVHGPLAMGEFRNWLSRQANMWSYDPRASQSFDNMARELRLRTYGTMTGLKNTIALEHLTSLPQTAAFTGWGLPIKAYANSTARGIWSLFSDPGQTARFVHDSSPYMRARHEAPTLELGETLKDITQHRGLAEKVPLARDIDRYGRRLFNSYFRFINHNLVAVPTWMQVYNEARAGTLKFMGENFGVMEHPEAAAVADKVVGKSHGSGLEVDMGRLQSSKGNEGAKLLNMFNVFRGTVGHIAREGLWHLVNDDEMGGKMQGLYALTMAAVAVPTLASLVTDQGPSDWSDPQEVTLWMMMNVLDGVSHMRYLGPLAAGLFKMAVLNRPIDFELSPAEGMVKRAGQGAISLAALGARAVGMQADGIGHQQIRDSMVLFGLMLGGYPFDQLGMTAQSIYDQQQGTVEQPVRGALFGHEHPKQPIRLRWQ